MLTDKFYQDVLLAPVKRGATLYIVSGYATAAMAARHMQDIHKRREISDVKICLIIGMTAKDGISETNHRGICSLVKKPAHKHQFECRYIPEDQKPVHAKTYAWFDGGNPICGFVGSANYTQSGFFSGQREAVEKSSPREILQYYKKMEKISRPCSHADVQGLIKEDEDAKYLREDSNGGDSGSGNMKSIISSLLDKSGNLPKRSGLNWGQRPEARREPNQAYIRLPVVISRTGFFPARGQHFTLHTDDGQVMLCNIRQDDGKAIHSTQSNSIIGTYFRHRLGVPLGELVLKEHLLNYGRTDITFYKIDDENYFMDFSVDNP
ncbi:MAG: restriction endonuclease PLD domain-containing protein [Gammaproteobacteria bacterium]